MDKAKQERQQKIVQAEGEAVAAALLGEAISKNPGYLKLRKLRASANISRTVSFVGIQYAKANSAGYTRQGGTHIFTGWFLTKL